MVMENFLMDGVDLRYGRIGDLGAVGAVVRSALDHAGIECCRSDPDRNIEGAASAAGLSLMQLRQLISRTLESQENRIGGAWENSLTGDLTDFLVRTHHACLREKLPFIRSLFRRALESRRSRRAKLEFLAANFAMIDAMIREHFYLENNVLFPRAAAGMES